MSRPRITGLPATKVCAYEPCGKVFAQGDRANHRWLHMRFCTPDCGRRGTATGPAPRASCAKELHAMTPENVRVNNRGSRTCKACESAAARARAGGGEPEPVAEEPSAVSGPGWPALPDDAPPWRPGGWSAESDAFWGAR